MTDRRILGLCLAVFSFASVGAAARAKPPPSDARLEQLVDGFAGAEGAKAEAAKAEAALRRAGLRRVLPRLVHLQRGTLKNEDLYTELAFTLAYLGVDYRRNVGRLTALDELWDQGDPRWKAYVSDESDMRESIPAMMGTLYDHNHDPALLRTLLT